MSNGSRHNLYMAAESSYGEIGNDPVLQALRITGTTLGLSRDSLLSAELRNDRQISDFRLGADNISGDINFELSYGSFDTLMEAALLSPGWQTGTPSVGTDRIIAGSDRRSFSFVRHFEELSSSQYPYIHYYGCEVNTLSLTIAANQMITGTMGFIGKGQNLLQDLSAMGTPTYPSKTTTKPLDSFTGILEEGGSTLGIVTELTINLANGITPRFTVGSRQTINPSVENSNLTGSITVFFESAALMKKFVDETASSLYFTMPDNAGNTLAVRIPKIYYTGGQPDVTGPGPVSIALPFQAVYDTTLQTNIAIERTGA